MLISIIIPTRDRADYLKYSVQTALKIDDIEIEVIVSDNASIDHTEKIISSIKDNRLKFQYQRFKKVKVDIDLIKRLFIIMHMY